MQMCASAADVAIPSQKVSRNREFSAPCQVCVNSPDGTKLLIGRSFNLLEQQGSTS